VARVYTEDPERIQTLGREHDLWYYLWRQGYAVIRTDRNRLPSDAQIDHEMTAGLKRADSPFRGSGTIPARPCYRTVEQTHSDLQALALARPDLAQWVDYGDSWERQEPGGESGYDLLALVLSNQNIAGPKPVFMVMAAMHAREMSTAETAARFAELLFDGYGIDPNITWMLDYFEIHIMAQHNPDGRKMAEAECVVNCFPNWRKNTKQNYCGTTSTSRGADLNRNSDSSFWGGSFASGDECSEFYHGPTAASEPETMAVESYAAAVFPDFREALPGDLITPADANADGVFISIHSAGDIVFYPWEGTNDVPPNHTGLRGLGQKMGFVTSWPSCQNCFLGRASGTTVDNVYEVLGIASYTFEIGSSWGQSCSSFENIVLPETLEGLMTAARHSRQPYQSSLGPDILDVELTMSPGGATLTAVADDTRRTANGGGEPDDSSQAITEVRYSIGLPPWLAIESFAMDADDGLFDEATEAVSVQLTADQMAGETQLIYVYATDADGDTGPPGAVFTIEIPSFQHGFEP
jgi:hypothetical protein